MNSMLQRFKGYINANKVSFILLLCLMAITTVITLYKLQIQFNVDVAYWDTFQYLNFARRFAFPGLNNDLSLSPFLPYLTSLLFSLGYVSSHALFILDGIIYILGVAAFYCLLKMRFRAVESFAGSIIYATFSVVLTWVAVGGIDLASVSFSIMAILFTIMAVKKDSRYYYLAFPLAAIAFFTKYTAGLIGLIMLFYIFIKQDYLRNLKNMVVGILIGSVIALRFIIFFYTTIGNPFPFLGQFKGTVSNAATTIDSGFNPDYLFYLKNLPNYISSISNQTDFTGFLNPSLSDPTLIAYLLLGIMVLGLLIYLLNIYLKVRQLPLEKLKDKMGLLKLGIFIILLITFYTSIGDVSYVISIVILLIIFLFIYQFFRYLQIKNADFDVTIFLWLAVYMVFNSILATKNDRYFVNVMPALAFLIVLAINCINNKTNFNYGKIDISSLLSTVLVVVVLSSTLVFLDQIPQNNYAHDMKSISQWLHNYDDEIFEKTVYSNHWPGFEWYLNKRIYRAIPQTKESMFKEFGDLKEFSKFLQEKKAYYYIYRGTDLYIPDYHVIKRVGIFTIFEIDNPKNLEEPDYIQFKPSIHI
ncbi:MAG: glycosyltransferase family 39 protein [Methanobacteriaceae archaeon]|nr:glycosyltransferase family 39 protein [Methanobacteriaceae archaeon]